MDRHHYEWLPSCWEVAGGVYDVNSEATTAAFRRLFERLSLEMQGKKLNKKCQISADMEDIFDE
jgi:hypothetical protein